MEEDRENGWWAAPTAAKCKGNGYVLIVKNLPQLGNGQNTRCLANSVVSMMDECARNAKRFLTT